MRLRDMQDLSALRELQQREAKLQIANMERDRLLKEGRRSAVVMNPQGGYDRQATLRNLSRLGDYEAVNLFEDNWAKQDEQAGKAREQQLKASGEYNKLAGQAAQWVKSQGYTQQAYDAAKQHLISIGVPAEVVGRAPDVVDPAYIDGVIQSTLSEGDRLNRDKYNRDLTLPLSDVGKLQYDYDRYLQSGGRFGPPPVSAGAPASAPVPGDITIKPNARPETLADPDLALEPRTTSARNSFEAALNNKSYGPPPDGFRWTNEGRLEALPEYWEKKGKHEGNNVKNEATLRDDFTKAAKPFTEQRDAYARIRASATNPSPAGDIALLFNYLKVLDPGSTVRESEFQTVATSGGLPARVQSIYNKMVNGMLPDEVRADVVGRSGMLFNTAVRNHKRLEAQYSDIANRYGMDPRNVVIDIRDNTPDEGASAPAAREIPPPNAPAGPKPAAPAATPRISSDAEFKALPSGSLFIAPDGTTRRKP